jgi:hypothetical protein
MFSTFLLSAGERKTKVKNGTKREMGVHDLLCDPSCTLWLELSRFWIHQEPVAPLLPRSAAEVGISPGQGKITLLRDAAARLKQMWNEEAPKVAEEIPS